MDPVVVRPHRYRMFGSDTTEFFLIVDEALSSACRVDGPAAEQATILSASAAELSELIQSTIPSDARVLALVRLTDDAVSAGLTGEGRKIALAPLGDTDVHHLDGLLEALELSDPEEQERLAQPIRQAVQAGGAITISDAGTSSWEVDLSSGTLSWDDHAGLITKDRVQLAPSGWLQLRAPHDEPLPVEGVLSLSGFPIVEWPERLAQAEHIYRELLVLAQSPVTVTVRRGEIVGEVVAATDQRSAAAAAMLNQLFQDHPECGVVQAVGFGLHTGMSRPMSNSGWARAYGGRYGTSSVTLGPLSGCGLRITLVHTRARVTAEGRRLLGQDPAASRTPRRLNRVSAASCGCFEG